MEVATTEAQFITGESDLDLYDSHIIRQKNHIVGDGKNHRTVRGQSSSDGGSRFGAHRDNHDNPGSVRNGGKSRLRYSMSIILTETPTNVAPSSMTVLEPSEMKPKEYPRARGGYVLFRSQVKHTSNAPKEGQPTFLKLVFFFKRRGDAHPPGGYCDHMNRPYYDIETFMDAASYVHHRLGPHDGAGEHTDVVTLADVWSTACEQMPLLVGKQALMGTRSKGGGLEWSSGRCSSCCFGAGIVDSIVAARADKCAPRSLCTPNRLSSPEDMRAQLAKCVELDDMTWTMTGKVKRVNATCFQQPRRKSWSVVTGEVRGNSDGKRRVELFSYSQSYRPVEDWCAAPIPRAVFELGVACWKAVWDYLSPISQVCVRSTVRSYTALLSEFWPLPYPSQVCPPTGCQLMAYLTVFDSNIGRHRDNGLEPPDGQHCRLGNSVDENSQIRGSSVIVYTAGPPMTFALSAPPRGMMPWEAGKLEYEIQTSLTVTLGEGTLYVLDPRDDENYCHEAWFEPCIIARGADVRRAYVFRWLSKRRLFYADECGYYRYRCTGE